jgi:predicted ATP-dependent endonuclease of OLD family
MPSRLSEFRIEGLIGLYDHRIALNLEDRITIIIGPNGRGKTVCLKIIEALFRNHFGYLSGIPFRTASFYFTGGETIMLHRIEEGETQTLNFSLQQPGKELVHWTPAIVDARLARDVRRFIPPQWEADRH